LEIPAHYQLVSALLIGVLVAIGAAYRFFADLKRLGEGERSVGARSGGEAADLGDVVRELRKIRSVMQRHLDVDRTDELIKAVDRLADGIARAGDNRTRRTRD
jgi:hypothetical protein